MPRRFTGGRLVLATHNPGKLVELQALLPGVDLVSAGSLGLPEPVEDAADFVGNARIKALAATKTGLPALSDDSGFCLAALGGAPGVHSADWAGPGKDFSVAIERVRAEVTGTDDRAWFICALCMAWPDGHTDTFLGRVDGTMVWPPRGTLGFGYDPLFVPRGGRQTFGEMDPADKHAISHRARAMAQLLPTCFVSAQEGP